MSKIISQMQNHMAKLKPGDVFTMPDGEILGNLVIPAGLAGEPGKPIIIQGGNGTVIRAPKSGHTSAIWSKAPKHVVFRGFAVAGGWDALSISGASWDDLAEGVVVDGITVSGSTNDGLKIAMAHDITVTGCDLTSGGDQALDLFGVELALVKGNKLTALALAAFFCKAGSSDIVITDNHIISAHHGIHIGDHGSAKLARPNLQWQAQGCVAAFNTLDCGDADVVFVGANQCSQIGNSRADGGALKVFERSSKMDDVLLACGKNWGA